MSSSLIQQDFDKLLAQQNCWKCDFIFNEAQPSATDPIHVNLSDHFRNKTPYIFPEHFHGIEQLPILVVSLQMASIKCGFQLIRRTSKDESVLRKINSKFGAYVTLACSSHQPYQKNNIPKSPNTKQRNTNTKRPIDKANKCPFVCHLQMYKLDHSDLPGRWILKGSNANDGCHYGHWQLQPGELTVSINQMTPEEKKLACQCSQISFTTSASGALINLRNELGISYSDDQIRYLNKKEQAKLSALNEDASSADALVAAFKQRSDVAFLTVCYSPTDGLMLSMSDTQTRLNHEVYLSGITYNDKTLQPESNLVQLYNSSIGASGSTRKLLLIFMFATTEELRLIRMFPEFCCCDTTFGTNREKKELFTLASLDANNQGFNCGRAFVPNSQSWVFHLLFKHCLPTFWGKAVTEKLQLMITDGCTQEYMSFIRNTGVNRPFPNAIHGLCDFHLLVMSFHKYAKKWFSECELDEILIVVHLRIS